MTTQHSAGLHCEHEVHPLIDYGCLISVAATMPHKCSPDCPGEQNRRKLEVFDDLLETAKELYHNMGEPKTAGWHKLEATIAKAEGRTL